MNNITLKYNGEAIIISETEGNGATITLNRMGDKMYSGSMLLNLKDGDTIELVEKEMKTPPPIGIMPKLIHMEQRLQELNKAIKRYNDADENIPWEWLKESHEICKELDIHGNGITNIVNKAMENWHAINDAKFESVKSLPFIIYDKLNPIHYEVISQDHHTDEEVGRVIREHLQKFNLR